MSGWFDEGTEESSEAESRSGADRHAGRGSGPHGSDRAGFDRDEAETDREGAAGDADAGGAHERYRVKGDELLGKVKQIVREGNVRKITIRKEDDEVLLSFPLAAGVLGAALLPMWAAIGAVAALVGNCSIEVERRE